MARFYRGLVITAVVTTAGLWLLSYYVIYPVAVKFARLF